MDDDEAGFPLDEAQHSPITDDEEAEFPLDEAQHLPISDDEEAGFPLDEAQHLPISDDDEAEFPLDEAQYLPISDDDEAEFPLDEAQHLPISDDEEAEFLLDEAQHLPISDDDEAGFPLEEAQHLPISDDEAAGFPLDEAQHLPISDDEEAKGDLSTERAPRLLGLIRFFSRLGRRGRGRRRRCPTIRFPCSRMPSVCANMRYAIRLGKPSRLTRTTNRAQIRRNRRNAPCRHLRRRPAGHNCDEYPFASTFQGGRGSVVRMVPRRENSIQGAVLGAFYRRNRIGHGGCFRVSV